MSDEMAAFIAEFVLEELHRGVYIDHYTIKDAADAWHVLHPEEICNDGQDLSL